LLVDAAQPGSQPYASRVAVTSGSNSMRGFRRKLLRKSLWPDKYYAQIRVRDPRTDTEVASCCSFLLPHEVVDMLMQLGNENLILSRDCMDPLTAKHLDKVIGDSGTVIAGTGLHSDGVPCNWDKTESVEAFSFSLPGLGKKWKHLRIPLVAIPHSRLSQHTFGDISEVLAWSYTYAYHGFWPASRHDGTPFWPSDAKRGAKAGGKLHLRSALCEVRGDWKMFQAVFRFPTHNSSAGICWKCKCKKSQVT
jgi:hypothetical protein